MPQGTILGPVLWNIYINDLTPDVPHIKYADDSTLYHTIMKANADITDITPRRASILKLHENQLQNAADQASLWCENNRMLLNANKSQSIIFTLQKTINIDPIKINDSAVSNSDNVKLLGVTFDRHLKFSAHVSMIIEKCRPIFHAMCQLRKAGVNNRHLTFFYQTRVLPHMTYAAQCWFPQLGKGDAERLEKYQRHCLRFIYPDLEHTENRLQETGLPTITTRLTTLCEKYVRCVRATPNHPLYSQSNTGRISTHSGRHIKDKSRTALRSKSLFQQF